MSSEPGSPVDPSAAELLGPDGPLSKFFDGYEARPGQLTMAQAVEDALSREQVLLCEAGTGTGKTLAYLVPATLSGKKVVISTATRALQEQIVGQDLPLVRSALGITTDAAVMKGLGNYLCRRRYAEFRRSPDALKPRYAQALETLEGWVSETASGDVSEAAELGENDPVWPRVTSSSETRVGAGCEFFDECFVTRMKRNAEAARLLIVNHHLFFADLALRGPHPGRVIPNYDAVIFDEAHRLEDVATMFFGVTASNSRVEKSLSDAERTLRAGGLDLPLLGGGDSRRLVESVRVASQAFYAELALRGAPEGRLVLERDAWVGPLEEVWHRLDAALEALEGYLRSAAERLGGDSVQSGPLENGARRQGQLRDDLARIVDSGPGMVAWIERTRGGMKLGASPVDVSDLFREKVFESIPAVVLTSATLTVGAAPTSHGAAPKTVSVESGSAPAAAAPSEEGSQPADMENSKFRFLRERLGLEYDHVEVNEALLPSPFDFPRNALLYTPRDLPEPRHPSFTHAVVERVAELVKLTDGGAFVLTTSIRAMRAIHRGLGTRVDGRKLLLQGEAPKAALLEDFRGDGRAVLVATASFWEGVDVPGHALRLVVLEKIPFAVPTDPIVLARTHAIEARGGNAFMELHVPAAAISLKQGFGRLIRHRRDRGIVALLDERLHRRGYGKKLLRALPPARRVSDLDEVDAFWNQTNEG